MVSSISRGAVAAAVGLLALSFVLAGRAERMKGGRVLVLAESGLLGVGDAGASPVARPLPGCTDFGWAVWLQWSGTRRDEGDRCHGAIMLLPDNVPEGEWRALRTWLRHKAPHGAGEGAF